MTINLNILVNRVRNQQAEEVKIITNITSPLSPLQCHKQRIRYTSCVSRKSNHVLVWENLFSI